MLFHSASAVERPLQKPVLCFTDLLQLFVYTKAIKYKLFVKIKRKINNKTNGERVWKRNG